MNAVPSFDYYPLLFVSVHPFVPTPFDPLLNYPVPRGNIGMWLAKEMLLNWWNIATE